MHLFWLQMTKAWEKHLWFEEIMSVLNLIPGSGMGKAVPYEAGFPGNCTVDHDILGALVTQNSLMSVLLNAH